MYLHRLLAMSLLISVFILTSPANAGPPLPDTVWITTFDQDFYNWATPHVETFDFPPEEMEWSQILMFYTIECPGPPADCDPWDRLGHLRVIEQTPKGEEHYEIARVITPYDITGSNRPGSCTWVFDVTDYETLLHDSVTLRNYISTWIGDDRGWLVTIEFAFIPGVTELEPYRIVNLWTSDYIVYGDPDRPVEDHLQPVPVDIDSEVVAAKVRAVTTGHGQGNTNNAAEFSNKWHEVLVDSDQYIHQLWRNDCADNECSPQGGTWKYPRAGWCPGDRVYPWDLDVTGSITPGTTVEFDYNIEPYENFCRPNNPDCEDGVTCTDCDYNSTGHTEPHYVLNTHLILYRQRQSANMHSRVIAGPGRGYNNPPVARVFPPEQDATHEYEFTAYGVPHYGVQVSCGHLNGLPPDVLLTGPGPGSIYAPHVRGFEVDGTPVSGINFFAYGTTKFGVNVSAGDIDADGFDEIVTGAGPGAVFGPHVRAFDYDGSGSVTPIHSVSFLAYGTRKWGVAVAPGDVDGDHFDEIMTGAGPGTVFGPHVRGWNVDGGTAQAMPEISFFAYGTRQYGVVVTCGDVDGDVIDEIITAPGPSPLFGSHIRGWNYDDGSIGSLPGYSFFAWPSSEARYGARIFAGANLNADGRDELVVGKGPDPSAGSSVKAFVYDGSQATEWFSLLAFPSGWTHGANVTAGFF